MNKILILLVLLAIVAACNEFKSENKNDNIKIVTPKVDWLVELPPVSLDLDPFYKKYIYVNGIHVLSSWRVPDSALFKACDIVMFMTDNLPKEYRDELIKRNARVAVMARYEGTTDIPEHAYLENDTSINWDVRARGLGGEVSLPLTTCAEENLLCYQIDKYHAEDILVHEFAHTIHMVGILTINPEFNDTLQKAFDNAISEGKWIKTYASTDVYEYFAEGVQDWFNVNAEVSIPDGKHNHVNTRSELRDYDRRLYEIIEKIFPNNDIQFSCHSVAN